MIVRFTRGHGKPNTLTCIRDDGTVTFTPSAVGVHHDLIHYAVETTLGCTDAFYGLVAAGRDIDSFGTNGGRKDHYPTQTLQVELIVGLLQWPALSGAVGLTDVELTEQLAIDCEQRGLPTLEISPAQWAAIHDRMRELFGRWASVAAGGVLELVFPL
jgi:hypothetical protein